MEENFNVTTCFLLQILKADLISIKSEVVLHYKLSIKSKITVSLEIEKQPSTIYHW